MFTRKIHLLLLFGADLECRAAADAAGLSEAQDGSCCVAV